MRLRRRIPISGKSEITMKIKGIDHKWLLAVLIVLTAALVAVYIYQTRDMRYAKIP